MTDRAVSELVAYILIFGIIFTGATLALTIGESQLDNIQQFEQKENAERAFVLLGQNFEEIEYSRAVTVSGTIALNEGRIRYENASEMTVTTTDDAGDTVTRTLPLGSIVYEMDDTSVRYESGLVTRTGNGHTVRSSDPRVTCGSDNAFVSVLTLQGTDGRQVSGGTIQVSARQADTELAYPLNRTGTWDATDPDEIAVEIDSARDEAWHEYLETGNWTDADSDGEYECDVEGGSVYVRQTVANTTFTH